MLELIVAVDENMGIGRDGGIPWKCSGDMANFRRVTSDSVLVMGRKTCETLPRLNTSDGRIICCLTRGNPDTTSWNNDVTVIHDIGDIPFETDRVIIAGGADIYSMCVGRKMRIHLSIIKGVYDCDRFLSREILDGYEAVSVTRYEDYDYYVLERAPNPGESQYLKLMGDVLNTGSDREGRNGGVRSVFGGSMTFDLRDGFPLLTTKKMFLRGIVEELLFFLRGDTDSSILSNKKVRIWEGNTSKSFIEGRGLPYAEGVMGPMYGYQWRSFNRDYVLGEGGTPDDSIKGGIDQLANVVKLIREDPHSRRILLTTYNPAQADEGVLYPCHSIINQFYVDGDYLDMSCYNRSQDLFLGTPYNIASSSLMLLIISQMTGLKPGRFILNTGDTHIYESHLQVADLQLKRIPFIRPTISINRELKDLEDLKELTFADFYLNGYEFHPSLKADMVA
jgi:thymidylate synthase/dihydrofolate reductase